MAGETQKLCECGCGEPAPVAVRNHTLRGYVKGEPFRFVQGHNPNAELCRECHMEFDALVREAVA